MNLERKFSKELAGDLRKETADKLREARKNPTNFRDLNKEIKGKKKLPEKYKRWAETEENFEQLKKDIFGKIFKTEKYKEQKEFLGSILIQQKKVEIREVQEEYDKKFYEILRNCPLSQGEKEKYLSTQNMEKMSLEDYLTLLKRLSGEAFYHVTRYGVRENTFMSTGGGHKEGEGSFIDSFSGLLKDGNINSFTSTVLKNPDKLKSIFSESGKEVIKKSIKEGKSVDEIVDKIMSEYQGVEFLDKESAHFSYGKDLHHMYGAEKDYKVYFYYPVEYILQNDFFHKTRESQIDIGKGYYHNKGGIKQQYNDIEIFNFGKGVPINAGILCITGDVEVDPKTGSQYFLENGKPVKDEKGEFKKPEKTVPSKEYWENYFNLHPEIRPSKIIYGDFYTSTYEEDKDLEKWAESKNVWRQDEDKKEQFREYAKTSRKVLREIFTEVVEDAIKEE